MVARADIRAFVNDVVRKFRPSRVILFGSYACGQPNEDSDVDLMVVHPCCAGPAKSTVGISSRIRKMIRLSLGLS
jgi:predicted nucleotidyltransferase